MQSQNPGRKFTIVEGTIPMWYRRFLSPIIAPDDHLLYRDHEFLGFDPDEDSDDEFLISGDDLAFAIERFEAHFGDAIHAP